MYNTYKQYNLAVQLCTKSHTPSRFYFYFYSFSRLKLLRHAAVVVCIGLGKGAAAGPSPLLKELLGQEGGFSTSSSSARAPGLWLSSTVVQGQVEDGSEPLHVLFVGTEGINTTDKVRL